MIRYICDKRYRQKTQKFIKSVVNYLNEHSLSDNCDLALLDNLALTFNSLCECEESILSEGVFSHDRYGQLVASPAIRVKKYCDGQLNELCKALGVSPAARKKLLANADNERSELEEFLG